MATVKTPSVRVIGRRKCSRAVVFSGIRANASGSGFALPKSIVESPRESTAELHQVVLVEDTATDENFAQVGSGGISRRSRLLELVSGDDITGKEEVLEIPR